MTPDDNQESQDDLRDSLKQRMGDDAPPSGADDAQPRAASQTLVPQDPKKQPKDLWGVLNMNLAISGPGIAQMTAFCRQLATLIDAGVPLLRALNILEAQEKNPTLKRMIGEMVMSDSRFIASIELHPYPT